MKTKSTFLGLVMLAALSGCSSSDDDNSAPNGGTGGTTTTGGTGSGGGGGDGSGGTGSTEPYTVSGGVCHPTPMAEGPEPIYKGDTVFGHIDSMATQGDTLYFAESADFDDIPPRIAKLEGDGAPTTLVAGARASQLKIIGDKLYYVEGAELRSVDLASASATPVVLNTVDSATHNIIDYDDQHIIYADDTSYYAAAVGAADLTGAVTLHTTDGIYSSTLVGETFYLSSRDGVYRVGVDGTGAADVVPDEGFPTFIDQIASDGTNLYFDNDDILTVVPVGGGEARRFAKAGADGLFYDTAAFTVIIPAGDVVYWADDGNSYGWSALDGSRCGILGTHNGFLAGGGALGDTYFYASGDGTVYRVARAD